MNLKRSPNKNGQNLTEQKEAAEYVTKARKGRYINEDSDDCH